MKFRRITSAIQPIQNVLLQIIELTSKLGKPLDVHQQAFKELLSLNPKLKQFKDSIIHHGSFVYFLEMPLLGRTKRFVIKYPATDEAEKLTLIKEFAELHAPALLAWEEEWLAQEYVDGILMIDLLRKNSVEKHRLFEEALNQLITIHTAIRNNKLDLSKLSRPRMGNILSALLRDCLEGITDALPAFLDLCGNGGDSWKRLIEWIPPRLAKLFSDLVDSASQDIVLGHGDYKPDNLLIKQETDSLSCYPIDWIYMGECSSWYDLAYLMAICLTEDEQRMYVRKYLRSMQQKGFHQHLDFKKAYELFLRGRMCAEITVAGANAKPIINGQSQHCQEFRRALIEIERLKEQMGGVRK